MGWLKFNWISSEGNLLDAERDLGDVAAYVDLPEEQHRFQLVAVESQQLADSPQHFQILRRHLALLPVDVLCNKLNGNNHTPLSTNYLEQVPKYDQKMTQNWPKIDQNIYIKMTKNMT